MNEFKYSDWNPERGTVPAYFVDASGTIEVGEVVIIDGEPADKLGFPLRNDGRTEQLMGWRHTECQSFDDGTVLVPLKGSRA